MKFAKNKNVCYNIELKEGVLMANIEEINTLYSNAASYVEYLKDQEYELKRKEIILPSGQTQYNDLYNTFKYVEPLSELYFCRKEADEILFIVLNELKTLYGDSIDLEEIGNVYKMIRVTNGSNPFEGNYQEINGEKILLFDRVDVFDSIPVVVHEGTHYLQDKYTTLSNGYHLETLPMLMEMIVADKLSTEMYDINLLKKNISNRFKTLKELIEKKIELEEANRERLGIVLSAKMDIVKQYIDDLIYTYIVSFSYAYALYKKYKFDPEYMLKNIHNVFADYTSIDELISYYGIEFKDPRTLVNIRQEISLLKK